MSSAKQSECSQFFCLKSKNKDGHKRESIFGLSQAVEHTGRSRESRKGLRVTGPKPISRPFTGFLLAVRMEATRMFFTMQS